MSVNQHPGRFLSLELLANELKEAIFLHLKPNDILSLMQTCKAFNDFIEHNSKLINLLTVRVSKVLPSNVISHRKYLRIFVDRFISDDDVETIKASLKNIQSVKVIIFNQNFTQYDRLLNTARNLITMCSNVNTINMIRVNQTELLPEQKIQSKVKTLSIWRNESDLRFLTDDFEEVNIYDAQMLSLDTRYSDMKHLKRINFFNCLYFLDRRYKIGNGFSLQEITFKDVKINRIPVLELPNLKILKLINVNLNIECDYFTFDFLHNDCQLDELHIENCGLLFWKQDLTNNCRKVKKLKLSKVKYFQHYKKFIEQMRIKVEALEIDQVTFAEKVYDVSVESTNSSIRIFIISFLEVNRFVSYKLGDAVSARLLCQGAGIDMENKTLEYIRNPASEIEHVVCVSDSS